MFKKVLTMCLGTKDAYYHLPVGLILVLTKLDHPVFNNIPTGPDVHHSKLSVLSLS